MVYDHVTTEYSHAVAYSIVLVVEDVDCCQLSFQLQSMIACDSKNSTYKDQTPT